ncbi:MAG: FkbM family methyltransferase [Clostridia bacterium]|nr:FkbM family methyltransferase [Clostridia bacterium]
MEKELWKYLKSARKPIVLYGMGNGADKIIAVLNSLGIPFHGVFASDGFVREKYFHGHKICTYGELKQKFGEMIVLLCFGSARPEVLANVKKISAEQELYAPEVPVIGGGLFTEKYVYDNKEAFEAVYRHLGDDLSQKTFLDIVNFKLSGKIDYLFDCEVPADEPYSGFFGLTDNESFLDLGAYNGDTVADFVARVKEYDKITAVEADVKTFKKLKANTAGFKNVRCENICISDFCGEATFGMRGGRNSGSACGNSKALFTTVDSLLPNERISYIKMDIEGEEKNAIEGARQTILKNKPKMLIACYHRTEDLLSIPQAVFSIRKDYKFYIRHFASLPAWDTNYYFV